MIFRLWLLRQDDGLVSHLLNQLDVIYIVVHSIWQSILNCGCGITCMMLNYLSEIGHTCLHHVLHWVKLLPQIFLHLINVWPWVHSVGLDVWNLLLVLLLLRWVSLNILSLVGIIWWLNNELGNFLWGSHSGDFLLFLEPLLDDLRNGHIINLLTSRDLCSGNCTFLGLTIKDNLILRVGLHLCLKKRLLYYRWCALYRLIDGNSYQTCRITYCTVFLH